MTLAIAVRCQNGVLLATDSALSYDGADSISFTPAMKGWDTNHLSIVFAGALWACDQVRRLVPKGCGDGETFAEYTAKTARDFRARDESNHPDLPAEFIVVHRKAPHPICYVTGNGGIFSGYDWLAIGSGSIEANVALDLGIPRLRKRTYSAVKTEVGRVLRVVGRWNRSVGGESHYDFVG